MSEGQPLDQRVIEALTKKPATSAEVDAVRKDAAAAYADLTAEADAADVASLSPLATFAQAGDLRQKAADLRFQGDRLEASIAALDQRISVLRGEEAAVRASAARAQRQAELDALVDEIRRTYPPIVRELTRLAKLIQESSLGSEAEALARGLPANFYAPDGPAMRIAEIRLPLPSSSRCAWESRFIGGEVAYHGLNVPVTEEA
jgi:hypothetical protein